MCTQTGASTTRGDHVGDTVALRGTFTHGIQCQPWEASKPGMDHADLIEHADSDHSLPASIRQQLLQSLVYLPVSVVGQPDALEKLRQHLQAEKSFCWKDYAEQVAQVWHYPVPAN